MSVRSRIWKQIYLSPLWDDIKVQSRQAFSKHLLKEWLNIPLKQFASISIELRLISLVMFSLFCGYSISMKIYYHIFTYMTVTYMDYKKIIKSIKECLEMRLSLSSFMWWFISGLWGDLKWIGLSICWLDRLLTTLCYEWGTFKKTGLTCSTGVPFSFSLAEDFHWLGTLGEMTLIWSYLIWMR